MNPVEALQLLDIASRMAPLSYEDQVKRCTAVDVLKKAVEPSEGEKSPEPEALPDAPAKQVRNGAKK